MRLQASEWIFRRVLGHQAPSFMGEAPDFAATNAALQSQSELDAVLAEAARLGIPIHPDLPKNWDTLTALTLALGTFKRRDIAVLDAGATLYSAFLKVLYLYGFRDLTAVNLEFREPRRLGPIRYLPGDITRLALADNRFDFVLCQSVIEHGVPIEAYFREMARLIRPGGLLVTSTDYWEPRLNTTSLRAYGTDVKVFCAQEVRDMFRLAAMYGWQPLSEPHFGCKEPVVHWRRLDLRFTFYTMALRMVGK